MLVYEAQLIQIFLGCLFDFFARVKTTVVRSLHMGEVGRRRAVACTSSRGSVKQSPQHSERNELIHYFAEPRGECTTI